VEKTNTSDGTEEPRAAKSDVLIVLSGKPVGRISHMEYVGSINHMQGVKQATRQPQDQVKGNIKNIQD
jgi:hypothetical protein